MANPSLQIGNSNWAIKEDNLLGYSTAGTRFVPQPITMTRASAGTRVNSSGLVETVELLGSELVTNGDFATDTDWTKGTGWTISGGNAIATNTTVNSLYQNTLTLSKLYKVSFTISSITSGSLKIGIGINFSEEFTVAGTYTYYGTPSNDGLLRITPSSGTNALIDNVSAKEVTRNNLARVDYDGTASSLLVEPERTNLITYSEDFSDSSWAKFGSTITSNAVTSPDGTENADKLVESGITESHFIRGTISVTQFNTYTLSVFAKYDGNNQFLLLKGFYENKGGWFDLVNKTFNNLNGGVCQIKELSNGWVKCSTTFSAIDTAILYEIYTSNLEGTTSYQGDGTSGVYIYGASLEEGSYPTSYIPTDGSTVTRVKDQYTKTGISNLIGQTEGVIFMDWIMNHQSNSTSEDVFTLSVTDGTTNNLFVINNYNNALTVYLKAAGTNQFSNSSFSGSDGLRIKLAFAYKVNDFSLVINGSVIATDNSGSVPLLNKININAYETALPNDSILVKDFKLYTTRLTDSELIALTTI